MVEITSPSNPSNDRIRKAALYARAGVPEYWILDPVTRVVDPFALAEGLYLPMPADEGGVFRLRVLPGLSVDPTVLWAALDRASRRSQPRR